MVGFWIVKFFLLTNIMKRKISPNAKQGRSPPRTPPSTPVTEQEPPTPPTPAFHGPPSFVGQPAPSTPPSQISAPPNSPPKLKNGPKLPRISKDKDSDKRGGNKKTKKVRRLKLKKTKRKTKLFRKK